MIDLLQEIREQIAAVKVTPSRRNVGVIARS